MVGVHHQSSSGSSDRVTLPSRAREIWNAREDLRAAFDIRTDEGTRALRWWYYLHGFREMGFAPRADDAVEDLQRPLPGLPIRGFTPISVLMAQMWRRRSESQRAETRACLGGRDPLLRLPFFKRRRLRGGVEQRALLTWFFTRGLAEANLLPLLTEEQAGALLAPDADYPSVARILGLIWLVDAGLRSRFSNPGQPGFAEWCHENGWRDWEILSHPRIALSTPPRSASAWRERPFGVNLFGHAGARLGVGEDVRMAACALAAAGVPFSIFNVAAGTLEDEECVSGANVRQDMPYAFNLFCMTGMETVRTILNLGRNRFTETRNIGFWPWELPRWPALWTHAYSFVDEIWASTEFAADALAHGAPIPVRQMPMAVTVEETAGRGRSDFGLPEGAFLFCFALDGLSSFNRKNPAACVRAFKQAFPDTEGKVGLVLKGLRVEDHAEWHALLALIGGDPRIHVITGSLERGVLLDLYRAIDCFVSLHRSEGFGRNIAEAMMLGRPVIATQFSGNCDFTLPGASALVPYRSMALTAKDYPFGDGLNWAEPNVEAAAEHMRRMVADADWRAELAAAGQHLVASKYNPTVVGFQYRQILEAHYKHGALSS